MPPRRRRPVGDKGRGDSTLRTRRTRLGAGSGLGAASRRKGAAAAQSRHSATWLRVRPKRLRKAGHATASFDERFMVRYKEAGRARAEMGEAAVQVYAGSRGRIALFGHYIEDGARRFQECQFADSHAPFHSIWRIAGELSKVAIIVGRASSRSSATAGRLIRKYHSNYPGNDMWLIFPPRGSPCLDIV